MYLHLYSDILLEIQTPDYLRDKLSRATVQKNVQGLERAIEECEAAVYPELGADLRKARDTLESLTGNRGG